MRRSILHKCFKFGTIYFADYGVIAEKPRVGHLLRIFRAPCGKNMRWIEK